jgi:hypothetical protein
MIDKLQAKITILLMTFPQDVEIPKKDYPHYMTLEVLKFRLMMFQNTLSFENSNTNGKVVYSCIDTAKTFLTVYRGDYVIDDMSFQVASDEIHISDGQFMLPNYVAKREVVSK